jgi:hypothetical protein
MGIYDPYRTAGGRRARPPKHPPPHAPPSRDLGKRVWPIPATGLRFAPSEVGLSLGRQNLDHNATFFSDQHAISGLSFCTRQGCQANANSSYGWCFITGFGRQREGGRTNCKLMTVALFVTKNLKLYLICSLLVPSAGRFGSLFSKNGG